MKIAELRSMRSAELQVELEQLRRHLFDLHSQAVTEKLENPHQLQMARKDIARVLTLLNTRGETDIEQEQRHRRSVAAKRRESQPTST